MTAAGVVTVADLLNRNPPVPVRIGSVEDTGQGISVGSLLRREGHAPHTLDRPHQRSDESDESAKKPAVDRSTYVRRGAITAGVVLAAGSVLGAAFFSEVAPTGANVQDPPTDGSYPGQGLLDPDDSNSLLPPAGAVQLDQAANVDTLDPGTPAPTSWLSVAFPGALAGVPAGTSAAAAADAAAAQGPGGGDAGTGGGANGSAAGSSSGGAATDDKGGDSTPSSSGADGSSGSGHSGGGDQQGVVDGLGNTVGDTAKGLGDTVGGPVGDTVHDLGDTVADTAGSLDDTVNGLLGSDNSSNHDDSDHDNSTKEDSRDDHSAQTFSSESSSDDDSSSSSAPQDKESSGGESSGGSSGGLVGAIGDLAGGLLG